MRIPTRNRVFAQVAQWVALGSLMMVSLTQPEYVLCQNQDDDIELLKQGLRDETNLLDGLRRRRLFELAEYHCQDLLSQSKLDPTSQASFTIEWMKTRTAKSVFAQHEQRKEIWRSVALLSTDFVVAYPDHPRKFLVQVQEALSHIAHSRLIRQEVDADMAAAGAKADALEEVQLARSMLSDLRREIATAIPVQLRKNLSNHDLTSEQLMNLKNNVQYQLLVCNMNRAQLYDRSDRLNRIDALNGVVERLQEVQRTTSKGLPLWWESKLCQIESLMLLGNPKAARNLARSLPKKDASISVKHRLLEQEIRVAIKLGDEAYSRELFTENERFEERPPQLELVALELATDQATRAATDERKQEWMAFAVKQAKEIEEKFGGYWGRRADLVLIGATGDLPTGKSTAGDARNVGGMPNPKLEPKPDSHAPDQSVTTEDNIELDLLIRLAEEANRKQRYEDALKAYDRVSKLAQSFGNNDQALRADLQAGLILEQQNKHELAAARMTSAADREPSLKLSPSTHLRGCWNFAQTIGKDATRREGYEKLLTSHLEMWNHSTSADQARIYLGGHYQTSQKWELALKTYLQISPRSSVFRAAMTQLDVTANQTLATLRRSGQSTRSTFEKIKRWLDGVKQLLPESDVAAAEIELMIAELNLIYGSSIPIASLTARFSSIDETNQLLVDRANAIKIVLTSIESPDDAIQRLAQIETNETALSRVDRCLAAVEQYSGFTQELASVRRIRLLVVENALALSAMSTPASSGRETSWKLKQAALLAQMNRHEEAMVVLGELESRFPRNAGVQMQLARAMTVQYEKTDATKALDKWRTVADRLKPNSTFWFEAKYEVARLLLESGESDRATKLLKYMQLTPPGWDDSSWKSKLEALLLRAEDSK